MKRYNTYERREFLTLNVLYAWKTIQKKSCSLIFEYCSVCHLLHVVRDHVRMAHLELNGKNVSNVSLCLLGKNICSSHCKNVRKIPADSDLSFTSRGTLRPPLNRAAVELGCGGLCLTPCFHLEGERFFI